MFTSNWVEKNANDYDELISAINRGDANTVESILNKCSISGWEANPLYDAVSCKNERIKQMMCDHYRKFDRYSVIVLKKIINDWDNFTARDKKIYETIIYELTVNNDNISKNNMSGSVLAQACGSGTIDIVKVLIKQGANLNFTEKNSKIAPLHVAILKNQAAIVEELLRAGANVNVSDKDGKRSLHFAAETGNVNIMKALLRHGASLDSKNYSSKCTPLYLAVEKGHVSMVEELVKAGASVSIPAKCEKNPLHLASELGFSEIAKVLLAYKADPNCEIAVTQYTPLFLAVEKGHLAVVESLLEANARVNALAADGKTPLYVGLEFDRHEIVNVLLEHGANVHVRDNTNSSTLLHTAARYDNKIMIEKLIAIGADIHSRDISGKTPLQVAAHHGKEAAQLLLSLGADKSLQDYNGQLSFHEAIQNNLQVVDLFFDVNEARQSHAFHEFVNDFLEKCHCPFNCSAKSNDSIDRVMMHLIKFDAINIQIHDHSQLKFHKINGKKYYDDCLAEVEQLKQFVLVDDSISLYDFLHMKPKRRLAYIERIPADLVEYKIYNHLIEDYVNETIERKSLFEMTRKALYEISNIFLPDICVEYISDFLSVENLRNLCNI
ncbi:serine/threonine-protein phosphatase 6 regulatory ankyrin repeat subunit A-like [Phymastichus coffea]|uniref:serine/threonine-protein phosphatase 6 regulatory ankyrin repeat subunit A-like n=1 Tax=Phymastichus coffea TaxID=108790 RepID=UPI00273B7707|nr:serine/threonine-protein phosphatase 6 regulatory ankyrin repeat subunit A-like [Phymastichus coffea]XP_058802579.1 serine/threonine-protein phosphatase 6 regulatory ankyrin repeat subunit A-like [Phymastichus coffea]